LTKKDNSTFRLKANLRKKALEYLVDPVVMETHGGAGKLFDVCYRGLEQGIVFEKDARKVKLLALQRPTWRVYQAGCEGAIKAGVGADLSVNLLDIDPYGDPWPVIDAFFESDRERPGLLCVAVNDGLRQKARTGSSWHVGSLQNAVSRYGNDLHPVYLEVCQEMLKEKARGAGYSLTRFAGYYCGYAKQMTHYLGVLELG
jgi:hypothetical protein